MSNVTVVKNYLKRFGYRHSVGLDDIGFEAIDEESKDYKEMVKEAQRGLGIIEDGEPGIQTIHAMNQPRCGVPDFFASTEAGGQSEKAKWPNTCLDVSIYIDFRGYSEAKMGIGKDEFKFQFERALKDWNSVININLYLVDNPRNTTVYVSIKGLSGSTLAWSYLADNTCGGKQQAYDIRRWTNHLIYLVVLHEVGHLIGLPHKNGNFIMNPSIITSLSGLTDDDIQRALGLGYNIPNVPDLPDPPDSPNPGDDDIEIIDGRVEFKYKGELLSFNVTPHLGDNIHG